MPPALPMLLLSAAISCLLLSGVMLYLRRLPDAPASFGWWALTYALQAVRFIVRDAAPWIGPAPALFGAEALQATAAILLLTGAAALVGISIRSALLAGAAAVVVAWAAVFVFFVPDAVLLAIPLHLLAGAALWSTAWILRKEDLRRPELELRLVIVPFVLWGAIEMAYPATVSYPVMVPWYILGSQAFAVLVAIGLVVGAQRRHFNETYQIQSRLAAAIDNVPAEIAMFDATGRLLQGNTRYLAEFGTKEDQPQAGLMFEDLMRQFTSKQKPVLPDGRPVSFLADFWARPETRQEFEIRLEDGRWLHVVRAVMPDRGFILVGVDISERKTRERELIRTAPLLRTTLDAMQEGVIVFDKDRGAVAWNERFLKCLELGSRLPQAYHSFAAFCAALGRRGDFDRHGGAAAMAEHVAAVEQGEARTVKHTVPGGTTRELRCWPVTGGGCIVFSTAA